MRRMASVPERPGVIVTAATPSPAQGPLAARAAEADASMRFFELLVGLVALLVAVGLAGVR